MGSQPTMTGFMIALVLVGFFVGVFGNFYSDISDRYGTEFHNSSIYAYDKMKEVRSEVRIYESTIENSTANKNAVINSIDMGTQMFTAGITALKVSANSVGIFIGMADQAGEELDNNAAFGDTAIHLKSTLITIVIILIFLGIILPSIIRWGRKL